MTFLAEQLQPYVDFSHVLAESTEACVLEYFRKTLAIDDKGCVKGHTFDPVTVADQQAETLIRAKIMETYPDHGILGEEHGAYQIDADWIWTLDPIDGTRAFITGMPLWGTLIALSYQGFAQVGVLNQPFLKERYFGTAHASFQQTPNGINRLKTRNCIDPSKALGTTTTPDLFDTPSENAIFKRLQGSTRYIRYGTDCYGYAMLALGQVDFVCETGLAPYDIRALIPIVRGAGGIITTWDGGEPEEGGQILASANQELHQKLLEIINQ